MNAYSFILTTALTLLSLIGLSQNTLQTGDLAPFVGEWTGSLTYLDYSTNEPYTMPANLLVEQGKNANELQLNVSYPKEPGANSKGTMRLSKDGKELNKERIVSVERLSNGELTFSVVKNGKDDNKKATIKTTYRVGPSTLVYRKEVQFKGTDTWILRNEYSYKR